ncbi:MAG TPA: BMP family ABC transporter substrate-binding protein [Anaerovoracaceae bacterium]|nr:BMP family ABC transporter substrate-binding protein [Anaerovoracaceae bacterium]
MKKILTVFLAIVMVLALGACGDKSKVDAGMLAFCASTESLDDQPFNQLCWAGVETIASEYKLECENWTPAEDTTEARMANVKDAVDKGATAIVCAGKMYAEALCMAAEEYPSVYFIGIDIAEDDILDYVDAVPSNVTTIVFREEQAGYLAGYAAAKEGFNKLGFLGGDDIAPVERYGSGFLQGVNDAAVELGKEVEVRYTYAGQFHGDKKLTKEMEGWYEDGTQIVFACGGGIYTSVLEAALNNNQYIIGADEDQFKLGEGNDYNPFITSALKNLQPAVESALSAYLAGDFQTIAGQVVNYGLEDGDYVGLPTGDSWNMKIFTVEEYDKLKDSIMDGTITVDDSTDKLPDGKNVKLKVIK